MKRRRRTPEQIIRKLRETDRLLAEGREVPDVGRDWAEGVSASITILKGSRIGDGESPPARA
jgi:hypothetical protein